MVILLCSNPCFNGSGTLTETRGGFPFDSPSLNPCFNGSGTLTPLEKSLWLRLDES